MAFFFDSHVPTLHRTSIARRRTMFIFRRSALAVLAALVAAWLLPHLVANWSDDTASTTGAAWASESVAVKFAKGP
jgi:hypothetical protein